MAETDHLFYVLNKDTQNYYNLLCNKLNQNTSTYEELVISLALTTTNRKLLNIYEQRNTDVVKELLKPIPKMLEQVHILLSKYKIDTLKALASHFGQVY